MRHSHYLARDQSLFVVPVNRAQPMIAIRDDDSPADGVAHQQKRRELVARRDLDRKSTRLNSSHYSISYAVFCLDRKSVV